MSSRTTRRALSSRQVNVDNNNINNGKSSSSTGILPSKKDSRLLLQRSGSTASSNASSATTNVNEKGFSSLSSDTLRRAISTGSSNSNADTADHGAGLAMKSTKSKQQPLGVSTKQNRTNIPSTKSSSSTSKPTSSSNSEPITIVEHRKRPSGDGYTVHKYLRGKLLGKGGFAKVYKVTSLDTNKEYAVKIVPKANLVKSRARQKVCFVFWCVVGVFG